MVERLDLTADHAGLEVFSDWLTDLAERHQLTEGDRFRLELVLTEALTNIMDYAGQAGREVGITVACDLAGDDMTVILSDDGPAFDPTAWAAPVLPTRLEDATPGGLGIHLMRQYSLAMTYVRETGHNVLRMRLPRAGEIPSG